MLTAKFSNLRDAKISASLNAVSAKACALVISEFSTFLSKSLGKDPVFTPILIAALFSLQASTTAFVLSKFPMFPGLILITEIFPFKHSSASL